MSPSPTIVLSQLKNDAIFCAIRKGDFKEFQHLLDHGASLHAIDAMGHPIGISAAIFDRHHMVAEYLDRGGDLHACSDCGNLGHVSVAHENHRIFDEYLRRGGNIHAVDKNNCTFGHYASMYIEAPGHEWPGFLRHHGFAMMVQFAG